MLPYRLRPEMVVGGVGEVAEWPIAPVLKTGDPKGSGGSNPSLSVFLKYRSSSQSMW
jgi:hypothetical protein